MTYYTCETADGLHHAHSTKTLKDCREIAEKMCLEYQCRVKIFKTDGWMGYLHANYHYEDGKARFSRGKA